MARTSGFACEEVTAESGTGGVKIGEAASGVMAFGACRREPNPSTIEPANSRTNTEPNARADTRLPREAFPNPRPFPITLFLRFTPIIWRDRNDARDRTPAPAKPPAADVTLGTGGKQTTT